MTLAQARAICPNLLHAAHKPEEDRRALESLGRWLMRFSPVVAIDPPGSIFLDVTGSERLFGGLDPLLHQVARALADLKISAHVVIAPTVGGAWAVASVEHGAIISAEQLIEALTPLPAAALRLDPATAGMLDGLGIETIGQLIDLPRDVLPARFGTMLLKRIDQALGHVAEPLVPLRHRSPIQAHMEFDGNVDSPEILWLAFKELLGRIIAQLVRCGCGARRIEVEFRCADQPPVHKTLLLSRPSREAANLFNLLRCMLETIHSNNGFTALRLSVPVFERLTDEQSTIHAGEEQAVEAELDHLIERLRARLGQEAVARATLVESHLPERAFGEMTNDQIDNVILGYSEGSGRPVGGRRSFGVPQDDNAHLPSSFEFGHSSLIRISDFVIRHSTTRPLHLLPTPREIQAIAAPSHEGNGPPISFTCDDQVHRISCAIGPERISGLWWEGRDKTRDYFDAQDETGRRFWLFRVVQTGRWFVHGVFE